MSQKMVTIENVLNRYYLIRALYSKYNLGLQHINRIVCLA